MIFLLFILFGLVISLIPVVTRTYTARSAAKAIEEREPKTIAPASAESVERFRAALRHRTVWDDEAEQDPAAAAAATERLSGFQSWLAEAYPAFNAAAEREVPSPFAVIYRWPGKDPDLDPVLLLAHYDVVPAEAASWTHEPFAADLQDGFVWARGALDTKNTLICTMEAVESLAAEGFVPERDIYLAFGGDEERSGALGAKKTAELFDERDLRFAWCLDEGSIVSVGLLAGVEKPLAIVGVEEKGFLDIELSVPQSPGHASRPPKVQAVAVLGRALHRISRKPFPWRLTSTVEVFFWRISPYVPFARALALANARKLDKTFFALAGNSPETAALMRTTVAMTQLEGSPADNVMPSEAKAILNLRLLHPWTVEKAVDYIRKAVRDPRVTVRVSPAREASDPVPAAEGAATGTALGWETIAPAIEASFPDAATMPFLVTATTDSRHYAGLCGAIYRFGPVALDGGELARIHGIDERISLDNIAAGIAFYRHLVEAL